MESKKYIFIIIFIIILITTFVYIKNANENYIIKINEEKISEEEFLTYLLEQKKVFEQKGGVDIWETDFDGVSAIEVAKQNALNSIILVKISVLNSEKLNVYLKEEDRIDILEKANELVLELKDYLDVNLPLETAKKIIEENKIEQKVFNFITENFELSENDFNLYFEDYLDNNKKDITTITSNIILINKSIENSENISKQIYSDIEKGVSFEEIKENYPEINFFENVILNEMNFDDSIENEIYNLNENSVSKLIETNTSYYIFNILNIYLNDLEELREGLKEEYVYNKKQEIYVMQTNTWANEITVTKNQELWDKITIKY